MADSSNSLPQASGPKQNSSPISTNSPTLPTENCFPQLAQKHGASWSVTCSVVMESRHQKGEFRGGEGPSAQMALPLKKGEIPSLPLFARRAEGDQRIRLPGRNSASTT